jgi:hypothetical protein
MYIISLSSSIPVSDASSFSSGISSPFEVATSFRSVAISGASTGIGSGRSDIVNFASEEKIARSEEGFSDVECNGKGTTALSAS